jgi:hypothetical protein
LFSQLPQSTLQTQNIEIQIKMKLKRKQGEIEYKINNGVEKS